MTKSTLLALTTVMLLSACASTRSVEPFNASAIVSEVDAQAAEGHSVPGRDYLLARNSFLDEAKEFIDSERRKARSPFRKVKSVIAGVGAIVGIGGLAASFAVDNEDTRSTIAQVSGSVASLSGLVALIPAGRGASGAAAASTYLEAELGRFEERWPAGLDSLSTPEWKLFTEDCRHIEETTAALQRIK